MHRLKIFEKLIKKELVKLGTDRPRRFSFSYEKNSSFNWVFVCKDIVTSATVMMSERYIPKNNPSGIRRDVIERAAYNFHRAFTRRDKEVSEISG